MGKCLRRSEKEYWYRVNVLQLIGGLNFGGAEKVVLDLAIKLNRNRYNVMVCCFSEGLLIEELQREGIRVIVLKKRYRYDFLIIFKLFLLMKRMKIDIVHAHMFTAASWGGFAAKLARVPVIIITEHGRANPPSKIAYWLIDRFLRKSVAKTVAVSHDIKRTLIHNRGYEVSEILVIHNGIDPGVFAPITSKREVTGITPEGQMVGTVARLSPVKDHVNLLNGAFHVLQLLPAVEFLIVGDGISRKELEDLADRLGISSNVKFLGWQKDIARILSALDLFVLPSQDEGISLTILEAMAMGVPVVATRVGGNPEVVEQGLTGVLVAPRDPRALAEEIIKLLQNESVRRTMAVAARKRVEQYFNVDRMVKEYEQLYEHCLAKKPLR